MNECCVIIGSGHASASLAPALRRGGWRGRILVVSEDRYLPYHRPPLSKTILSGDQLLEDIYIRPAHVYDNDNIEFRLQSRVEAIDRDAGCLLLAGGDRLKYDKLVIATGSRPVRLQLPGIDLEGIYYLRDYGDADRIRAAARPGSRAVIVGGGYIGLEAAAALNKCGLQVTVLEQQERVMSRVTAPVVADFITRMHAAEGVDIACDTAVSAFEGNGRVQWIACGSGDAFSADLVIIGAGILPNTELAGNAGLDIDNGILVDQFARTDDPDIYAVGDCTRHYNAIYDRFLRLESVQNANDQARIAAANLCGGDEIYNALPWFWSDQYDTKLQIAGLSQGFDKAVIRGAPTGGRCFSVFYLYQDMVMAVDAINRPADFMHGRRLITGRITADPELLEDPEYPLNRLFESESGAE